MATAELTIKRREGTGKEIAKRLRRAGAVPAILYGGTKTETVSFDPRAGASAPRAPPRAPGGVRPWRAPGPGGATVAPPMAEEAAVVAATATTAVAEPEVLTERKPKEGEEAPAADDKRPKRPERAEKTEK